MSGEAKGKVFRLLAGGPIAGCPYDCGAELARQTIQVLALQILDDKGPAAASELLFGAIAQLVFRLDETNGTAETQRLLAKLSDVIGGPLNAKTPQGRPH